MPRAEFSPHNIGDELYEQSISQNVQPTRTENECCKVHLLIRRDNLFEAIHSQVSNITGLTNQPKDMSKL